ncbi:MAG: hypothetical protein WA584_16410 [Pyrinomonadaceae bacterium]
MNGLNEKEQRMRDYWLGILSSNQTDVFETDWFGNDEDAELLEIARADLIDDYLSENLTETEYSQFENNFLLNNLEDVVLAKSSLQISREKLADLGKQTFFESFFGNVRNFINIPQVAVAVLLLVCFGLWFRFYYNDASQEIAHRTEPVANLENSIGTDSDNRTNSDADDANYNKKDAAETEVKNVNTKTNKESDEAQNSGVNRNSNNTKKQSNESAAVVNRQIVFLTVFRGSVKTINLTGNKEIVTLKLTMPGIDKAYKNYQLKIYDAGNNLVVKQDLGNKLSLKKSGAILTMPPLKGSLFKKNNTYKTYLVGIDENNAENELINYDSFRVE